MAMQLLLILLTLGYSSSCIAMDDPSKASKKTLSQEEPEEGAIALYVRGEEKKEELSATTRVASAIAGLRTQASAETASHLLFSHATGTNPVNIATPLTGDIVQDVSTGEGFTNNFFSSIVFTIGVEILKAALKHSGWH